jgi:hypothetical protein
MVTVHRNNEISLFDVRYPIIGPVRNLQASQFAPKQVFGDYTKDSEEGLSNWVVSDQRGGIGIKDMDETKDADRCWWSTCELGYKGHLTLPVLATDGGNDTVSNAEAIIEYVNELYVAFGASVRKWVEGTSSWGSELNALVSAPKDALVHKSKLYYACTTDFERFDGSTWTDGATLGSAQPCILFAEWDAKLFTLDNDGQLDYSIDEGVTWTTNAKSNLPSGYFNSLFTYRDAAGAMILYMGTKEGLYALDFDNATWIRQEVEFPYHDYNCKGATKWRDALYLSSGLAVYEVIAGNPVSVRPMGPDRDYGIPNAYRGSIIKLMAGHNALYAFIDATSETARDEYLAGEYGDLVAYDNIGSSLVMKWDGQGWSVVYLSGTSDLPLKAGAIATADNIYRLWFGINVKVFYVPLQVTLQNPIEATDFPFAASSEHISPWFDKNNATGDAIAVRVEYYATDRTATEYTKLYYGTDYDDDTWTLLTNTTFADGQIDADGETEFTFASGAGLNFRAIRFKEEFVRGSTNTLSPDRRWIRLNYVKVLDVREGFTVRVDCSHNYRFKTAKTLRSNLSTAQASGTLGQFAFMNAGSAETHRVRIADKRGVEFGGKRSEGVYEVDLVAP